MKFNVTIDWRGHVPGTVHFILPDKKVAGTLEGTGGYTASRVIDVGSEIIPGGRLYVQVITDTGVESAASLSRAKPWPWLRLTLSEKLWLSPLFVFIMEIWWKMDNRVP